MSAEVDQDQAVSKPSLEGTRPKFYPEKTKQELPEPDSLDSMIKGLRMLFEHDHVNAEEVKRYMTRYISNPADWHKYAKFDVHRYTRNLVDTGNGHYNLLVICWGEGQGSSIHNHSGSHCFFKMLSGSLTETLYEWPKNEINAEMSAKRSFLVKENDVSYIRDLYGLHRVENRSHTERAVSLHLYSPPYVMCQSFDERSSHVTTCELTYWSELGDRTPFKIAEKHGEECN